MNYVFIIFFLFVSVEGYGAIISKGSFLYKVFDHSHNEVGYYNFTVLKDQTKGVWNITSEMTIETTLMGMTVKIMDNNSFIFDGEKFLNFKIINERKLPFLPNKRISVEGIRESKSWKVERIVNGNLTSKTFAESEFLEVRNLISRIVRPEAVLSPGDEVESVSLDPLELEIIKVKTKGISMGNIRFQGKEEPIYRMTQTVDGDSITVDKFKFGLIYSTVTSHGYSKLITASCAEVGWP